MRFRIALSAGDHLDTTCPNHVICLSPKPRDPNRFFFCHLRHEKDGHQDERASQGKDVMKKKEKREGRRRGEDAKRRRVSEREEKEEEAEGEKIRGRIKGWG